MYLCRHSALRFGQRRLQQRPLSTLPRIPGGVTFSDEPASDAGRRGLVLELSVIALQSGELGPGPDGHSVARPVGHGHSIPIRVKTLWHSCAAGLALMSVLNVAVAPNTPAT